MLASKSNDVSSFIEIKDFLKNSILEDSSVHIVSCSHSVVKYNTTDKELYSFGLKLQFLKYKSDDLSLLDNKNKILDDKDFVCVPSVREIINNISNIKTDKFISSDSEDTLFYIDSEIILESYCEENSNKKYFLSCNVNSAKRSFFESVNRGPVSSIDIDKKIGKKDNEK